MATAGLAYGENLAPTCSTSGGISEVSTAAAADDFLLNGDEVLTAQQMFSSLNSESSARDADMIGLDIDFDIGEDMPSMADLPLDFWPGNEASGDLDGLDQKLEEVAAEFKFDQDFHQMLDDWDNQLGSLTTNCNTASNDQFGQSVDAVSAAPEVDTSVYLTPISVNDLTVVSNTGPTLDLSSEAPTTQISPDPPLQQDATEHLLVQNLADFQDAGTVTSVDVQLKDDITATVINQDQSTIQLSDNASIEEPAAATTTTGVVSISDWSSLNSAAAVNTIVSAPYRNVVSLMTSNSSAASSRHVVTTTALLHRGPTALSPRGVCYTKTGGLGVSRAVQNSGIIPGGTRSTISYPATSSLAQATVQQHHHQISKPAPVTSSDIQFAPFIYTPVSPVRTGISASPSSNAPDFFVASTRSTQDVKSSYSGFNRQQPGRLRDMYADSTSTGGRSNNDPDYVPLPTNQKSTYSYFNSGSKGSQVKFIAALSPKRDGSASTRIISSRSIRDSLPKELIDKIKAASQGRKTIAIIEPINTNNRETHESSSNRMGGPYQQSHQTAGWSGGRSFSSKWRSVGVVPPLSNSNNNMSDHDYCCPTKPTRFRSRCAPTAVSPSKMIRQIEESLSRAGSRVSSPVEEAGSEGRKDSGLESCDMSDCSEDGALYDRLPRYLTSSGLSNENSAGVMEEHGYNRLPSYLVRPHQSLLKSNQVVRHKSGQPVVTPILPPDLHVANRNTMVVAPLSVTSGISVPPPTNTIPTSQVNLEIKRTSISVDANNTVVRSEAKHINFNNQCQKDRYVKPEMDSFKSFMLNPKTGMFNISREQTAASVVGLKQPDHAEPKTVIKKESVSEMAAGKTESSDQPTIIHMGTEGIVAGSAKDSRVESAGGAKDNGFSNRRKRRRDLNSDCYSSCSSRSSSEDRGPDDYPSYRKKRFYHREYKGRGRHRSPCRRRSTSREDRRSWRQRRRSRSYSCSPDRRRNKRSRNLPDSQNRSRSRNSDYGTAEKAAGRSGDNDERQRRQERRKEGSEKQRQVEERRVIYVGGIAEGTLKADLRKRFEAFGPIVDISIHFREHGDNYGFVTFQNKKDAIEAVERGNASPEYPRYELSFGGRRAFCRERYFDLDDVEESGEEGSQNPVGFDELLRLARREQN